LAEGARARGARGDHLRARERVVRAVVDEQFEAELVEVERFRAVDVRNGHCDQLQLPVHASPSSVIGRYANYDSAPLQNSSRRALRGTGSVAWTGRRRCGAFVT